MRLPLAPDGDQTDVTRASSPTRQQTVHEDATTKLTVGDNGHVQALLLIDGVVDGRVLGLTELLITEFTCVVAGNRLLQRTRPQETSDLIHSEAVH